MGYVRGIKWNDELIKGNIKAVEIRQSFERALFGDEEYENIVRS